jgi:hypothetical protein
VAELCGNARTSHMLVGTCTDVRVRRVSKQTTLMISKERKRLHSDASEQAYVWTGEMEVE